MDLKLLQRLIRIMKRGELTELELEEKDSGLRLRLRRGGEPAPAQVHLLHAAALGAQAPPPSAASATGASTAPAAPERPAGHTVASPMVGTFYRAASPESEPFVQVGSRVQVESPLCIIEAMKVMNEIKSDVAGEILEILVENGEPVEFGQPLFLVQTD